METSAFHDVAIRAGLAAPGLSTSIVSPPGGCLTPLTAAAGVTPLHTE